MDKRDIEIIKMLKSNPRISFSAIAKALNISVTAVKKRLDRLEKNGIVKFNIDVKLNGEEKENMYFMIIHLKSPISSKMKNEYNELKRKLKSVAYSIFENSTHFGYILYIFTHSPETIIKALEKKEILIKIIPPIEVRKI